jgi:hypothetical protein
MLFRLYIVLNIAGRGAIMMAQTRSGVVARPCRSGIAGIGF